jgi:hypothetical protein
MQEEVGDCSSHEKEEALLKPLTLRILTTGDSSFSGRQHEFYQNR